MAKRGKGALVFFTTAIITFLLLGSIYALFFLFNKTGEVGNNQQNVKYSSEDLSRYVVKSQENINLLIIACEEINLPPSFLLFISYDAVNKKILTAFINPQTLATVGINEQTISNHYDYEGVHGGVKAVRSLLITDIDRYIRIDKNGMSSLVDFFGGIEYNLEDLNAIKELGLISGEQLLDGRRVGTLLFSKEFLQEQAAPAIKLIDKFIETKLTKRFVEKFDDFVTEFFLNVETNINQYDFALRKKGISQSILYNKIDYQGVLIDGEYSQERQGIIPSNQTLEKVFKKLREINGE